MFVKIRSTFIISVSCLVCTITSPVQAGTMTLTLFFEDDLSFGSSWAWTDFGGNWNASSTVVGQFWTVKMLGINVAPGLGDLFDISRHNVNPAGHNDIAPNAFSFFPYPGASAGVPVGPGAISSFLDHPGVVPVHTNVFSLETTFFPGGGPGGINLTVIDFVGVHTGVQFGDLRTITVPAPSALALLGLAGLFGVRRRRR